MHGYIKILLYSLLAFAVFPGSNSTSDRQMSRISTTTAPPVPRQGR